MKQEANAIHFLHLFLPEFLFTNTIHKQEDGILKIHLIEMDMEVVMNG